MSLNPRTVVRQRLSGVFWAAAGGVMVSAAVSVLLLVGTRMIDNGIGFMMYPDLRIGGVLAASVGALLAVVIAMARVHPLLSGIPAAWLLLAYLPPVISPNALALWYPEAVFALVSDTFGAAPFILLGAFVTAAIQSIRTGASSRQTGEHL